MNSFDNKEEFSWQDFIKWEESVIRGAPGYYQMKWGNDFYRCYEVCRGVIKANSGLPEYFNGRPKIMKIIHRMPCRDSYLFFFDGQPWELEEGFISINKLESPLFTFIPKEEEDKDLCGWTQVDTRGEIKASVALNKDGSPMTMMGVPILTHPYAPETPAPVDLSKWDIGVDLAAKGQDKTATQVWHENIYGITPDEWRKAVEAGGLSDIKCECGSEKIGSSGHSSWCPKGEK